jgi:hypothetical protein
MARSGQFRTLSDIRSGLATEGYSDINSQLSGRSLRSQLCQLLLATNAPLDKIRVEGSGGA